jgi:hypothetical protein
VRRPGFELAAPGHEDPGCIDNAAQAIDHL